MRTAGDILKVICDQGGCQLVEVASDEEEEKSYEEEMAEDVLSIMCHYTTKHYSRRAAEATTKNVSSETLQRMIELREQGTELKRIGEILREEGHKMEWNGGKEEAPISDWTIRKLLDSNGVEKAVRVITGRKIEGTDHIAHFLRTRIKQTGDTKDRVMTIEVFQAWQAYCEKVGLESGTVGIFGKQMKRFGFERFEYGGKMKWVGLRILGAV